MAAVAIATGSVVAVQGPQLPTPLRLQTTGCGLSPDENGSAVVVGDNLAVTAAHVVVAASQVTATDDGRASDGRVIDAQVIDAQVIALDTRSDVAILRLSRSDRAAGLGPPPPPAKAGSVGKGDQLTLVTATNQQTTTVRQVTPIEIEGVRSANRILRDGLQLDADVDSGDSGAGAFTGDGALAGIVFATGDDGTAWLTAINEVTALLRLVDDSSAPWRCDPRRSRLVGPPP